MAKLARRHLEEIANAFESDEPYYPEGSFLEEMLVALFPFDKAIPSYRWARQVHQKLKDQLETIVTRDPAAIEGLVKEINIRKSPHVQQLALPSSWFFAEEAEVPPWPYWEANRPRNFQYRLLLWISELMAENHADRLFACEICSRYFLVKIKRVARFCSKTCAQQWHTKQKTQQWHTKQKTKKGYYTAHRKARRRRT